MPTPSSAIASNPPALSAPGADLLAWLIDQALPTWASTGVDLDRGGFFEQIDLRGHAVAAPRRTRVVARQVYVFATAARRGWLDGADALVDHGLYFLLHRSRQADGTFASAVEPHGTVVDARFDLYEHAFALFALAAASRQRPHGPDRSALRGDAEALLSTLRGRWAHPLGGFEEAVPRALPLRSNPHMHLLEAALEWIDVSAGEAQRVWTQLADELAGLCLTHFIDPATGALRENFDGRWQPMSGAAGRLVEPGHQFEWAWLLTRWAALGKDRGHALTAARRLREIGEANGVDRARGVAVDALDVRLQVTDPAAKLWPQTERVKAWHQALAGATGDADASFAQARLTDAIDGLTRYLHDRPAGLWHEHMNVQGGFDLQACKASSLYHIVCAIDTLQGSR